VKTLGRTAISGSPSDLLPPCAETMVTLAEALGAGIAAPPLRELLLRDPGALVVFLSLSAYTPPESAAATVNLADSRLALPLWTAMQMSSHDGRFADWSRPNAVRAYRFSQATASIARHLIVSSSKPVSADAAAIAGLYASLGWLVLPHAQAAEADHQTAASLTRRLAREWAFPTWLANVLLNLDLAMPLAGPLACDANLLWIVQAAVGLAQEHLDLAFVGQVGNSADEALARMGASRPTVETLRSILAEVAPPPASTASSAAALLWRVGRLAVERLPAPGPRDASRLEEEAEQLRTQLAAMQHAQAERLRDLKLRALAEFAAGAGHEINNPLAVISGQAQHLLQSEENLDRARALERIVSQCQRIHNLLRDLMLYARPPRPKLRTTSLNKLIGEVHSELAGYALERRVALESRPGTPKIRLRIDIDLVRNALVCLLRNAIEAAPAEGWARIGMEAADTTVAIIVEDSGPGLAPNRREHLFDPFFSNRSAGRGAGLGLSKAWRIAQLHGGTLEAHAASGEPTRFVLTLPIRASASKPLPQKAAARKRRGR